MSLCTCHILLMKIKLYLWISESVPAENPGLTRSDGINVTAHGSLLFQPLTRKTAIHKSRFQVSGLQVVWKNVCFHLYLDNRWVDESLHHLSHSLCSKCSFVEDSFLLSVFCLLLHLQSAAMFVHTLVLGFVCHVCCWVVGLLWATTPSLQLRAHLGFEPGTSPPRACYDFAHKLSIKWRLTIKFLETRVWIKWGTILSWKQQPSLRCASILTQSDVLLIAGHLGWL